MSGPTECRHRIGKHHFLNGLAPVELSLAVDHRGGGDDIADTAASRHDAAVEGHDRIGSPVRLQHGNRSRRFACHIRAERARDG